MSFQQPPAPQFQGQPFQQPAPQFQQPAPQFQGQPLQQPAQQPQAIAQPIENPLSLFAPTGAGVDMSAAQAAMTEATFKYETFFKPTSGVNVGRFLPAPATAQNQIPLVVVLEHPAKSVNLQGQEVYASFVCIDWLRTQYPAVGQLLGPGKCPFCEAVAQRRADPKKVGAERKSRMRWLGRRADGLAYPQLWNVPVAIMKTVDGYVKQNGWAFVDPTNGYDFYFTKTGEKLSTRYEAAGFQVQPRPLFDGTVDVNKFMERYKELGDAAMIEVLTAEQILQKLQEKQLGGVIGMGTQFAAPPGFQQQQQMGGFQQQPLQIVGGTAPGGFQPANLTTGINNPH